MKNLILAAFLIIGSSSFAQMSASDVQMAMGSIANDGIQKIYLNNKRKYSNGASKAIPQDKNTFFRTTFTYSESSLTLNYYNSDSKLNQATTVVIPFASMERFEVSKTSISIAQTDSFNYDIPNQLDELEAKSLWATEYYAHVTSSEGSIPYLSEFDDTLGYFSDTCDFCTSCLEGTVFIESEIQDRVVLNYASRANTALINCQECEKFKNSTLNVESWGSVRWKVSSGFGEGVKGFKLIPYRTIAVDKNHTAYGSVVFIPDAVGTEVLNKDGTIFLHDGYFFAGDTGGAIKTNHIDVFTGIDDSHPFSFVKSTPKQKFKAYIVTDAVIIKELSEAHQK